MIGILCNHKREKTLSRSLHKLFMPLIKDSDNKLIVFSLSNINLIEKTVFGNLITAEEEVKPVKADLPLTIFNLSVQRTRAGVKKLRSLMEIEDLRIFNTVNQYNQWTILEMLNSNNETKHYILPYYNVDKNDIQKNISKTDNFVLRPETGSSLSSLIYARQYKSHYDLYSKLGKQECHKFDIDSIIAPYLYNSRWLILDTPNLITYRNKLFVLRTHVQKNVSGDWEVLLKTPVPRSIRIYQKLDQKIEESSLQIIKFIGCLIPELCIGYVDFVLDNYGNVYFLNLGGWDKKLLSKKQHRNTRTRLCLNILEHKQMLREVE